MSLTTVRSRVVLTPPATVDVELVNLPTTCRSLLAWALTASPMHASAMVAIENAVCFMCYRLLHVLLNVNETFGSLYFRALAQVQPRIRMRTSRFQQTGLVVAVIATG